MHKPRGFTLIELMIVVAIIGVLSAIAIPKFANLVKRSQEGRTRANLTTIRSALGIYYGDNDGHYPTDGLSSLTAGSKYLKEIPKSKIPAVSEYGNPGHAESTQITALDDAVVSTGTENGAWGYVNNSDSTSWGDFMVYCTHNDSKGIAWESQ